MLKKPNDSIETYHQNITTVGSMETMYVVETQTKRLDTQVQL